MTPFSNTYPSALWANAAIVWHDGQAQLLGREQHGQYLVDTSYVSGVDLAHVDSADLWELLEDDPVEAHLVRPEAEATATGNRRSSAADFRACQ